jgi:glycosyltransferase involved in cell wall biosynthesis
MRLQRLLFVGHMDGVHGKSPSMGEVLAQLFARDGYPVSITSTARSKPIRLMEIGWDIVKHRGGVDVMLLQVYGGLSFIAEDLASYLGRRLGIRVVMHVHGGAMPEFMSRYPSWTMRVLARADRVVVPSEYLARALRGRGIESLAIPNVVDVSSYPFRLRSQVRPTLLWMRAFHEIYNPEMALQVVAGLASTHPDVLLLMAGQDKGLLQRLRSLAVGMNLEGRVRFIGYADYAKKVEALKEADIFISTSRIDNAPVSVLEACAAGLPVVATNVGGMPYFLQDHSTALLVPDGDVGAMVDGVEQLLSNSSLAAALSAGGRELACRSDWPSVRRMWENLFNDLMGQQ